MSKELTQQLIGKLLPDEAAKDAIHIAVAPAVARVKVFPGQDVGLAADSDLTAPHVGIVDPFLREPVFPGQRYFLFLYPNTITGLRHEWTHPLFDGAAASTISREDHLTKSKKWIAEHADNLGLSAAVLMENAESWLEYSDYIVQHGSERWRDNFNPDEFWHHYEVITGKTVDPDKKCNFYCCTC